MPQQWMPPTPEEEALQPPDYTPWDALQMFLPSPSNIARGIGSYGFSAVGKSGIVDKLLKELSGESEGVRKAIEKSILQRDISTVAKGADNTLSFDAMRAGSPYGWLKKRGGTWYELKRYPEQRSAYLEGKTLKGVPIGVGGKKLHEVKLDFKNPLMVDVSDAHEGKETLKIAEKFFDKETVEKFKKKMTGAKAEKEYAKLEMMISEKVNEYGFDGVVTYDKVGENILPRTAFHTSKYHKKSWTTD